ncbi:MAG TPA: ATP-binding SpoIIE family protein phosphatase [Thermoanaerobaculia bacterium]|nr:ATP-binding SpoIIE family protein phosphatase [Thermoanaerobaculia bacterium]
MAAVSGAAGAEGCEQQRVETSLSGSLHLQLGEESQVGGARRAVAGVARRLPFGEAAAGRAGIATTELARNLLQHGGGGELLLWWTGGDGAPRLEILALDRGPGLADVRRAFEDGYSTAGTPGTGLGAVRRAADALDVWSQPGRGTAIWLRIGAAAAGTPFEVGAVTVPRPGEEAYGDAWAVAYTAAATTVLVGDGLGHGPMAAEASREAVRVFCGRPVAPVEPLLLSIHEGLRRTRGAAVAVARVSHEQRKMRYAAVGNIAGTVVCSDGAARRLLTHNGTLGQGTVRVQPVSSPCEDDALLVMHSDGVATGWSLDDYPGLVVRTPAVIAGVLYRDHRRGRDDATVLVLKPRRPSQRSDGG